MDKLNAICHVFAYFVCKILWSVAACITVVNPLITCINGDEVSNSFYTQLAFYFAVCNYRFIKAYDCSSSVSKLIFKSA